MPGRIMTGRQPLEPLSEHAESASGNDPSMASSAEGPSSPMASPFLSSASAGKGGPAHGSSRKAAAPFQGRGRNGSQDSLRSQPSVELELKLVGDTAETSAASQKRMSMELLRKLDEVLLPTQSAAAKLQDVLTGAEQLLAELGGCSACASDATWSERSEHLRVLKDLQVRREGLSAAVRACTVSSVGGGHSVLPLALAVADRVSLVSCKLAGAVHSAGEDTGNALRRLRDLPDNDLRMGALDQAGDLVELICEELRLRKRDQRLVQQLGGVSRGSPPSASSASSSLAAAAAASAASSGDEDVAMVVGAYAIAQGAVEGSRLLQARIIRDELSQEGATFHGLSEQCRALQQMWEGCLKLVASTDEAVHGCGEALLRQQQQQQQQRGRGSHQGRGERSLGSAAAAQAAAADGRYLDLVHAVVQMALEGVDLVLGALGTAPMGMVVVEDDLLLQYWVPEALTGLQALVEDVLPRVRHMPVVSGHGSSRGGGGGGGGGGSKDVQELRAAADKLPGRLYSLVLAVIQQVNCVGSEASLWYQNVIMTQPNLWCDEDVAALQSLEQFATKVLTFVKVLLYSASSSDVATTDHLGICSGLDDQLSFRTIEAADACCTLVKHIRRHLGVYENGGDKGAADGASELQLHQQGLLPGSSTGGSDESQQTRRRSRSLSEDSSSRSSRTSLQLSRTASGEPQQQQQQQQQDLVGGGNDPSSSSSSSSSMLRAQLPEIETVTARELRVDKVNMAGEGSFGKVYPGSWYRAKVAVKVLNGSRGLFESGRFWQSFQTEWSACLVLAHPNIVRFINVVWLYDVMGSRASGRDARELCIVMEWCGYGDLHNLIRTARAIRDAKHDGRPEPVPGRGEESRFRWAAKFYQVWDVRLEMACQIAAGLAFIHRSNFLHRDLKPQNILLALGWTRGPTGTDVEHLQAKICDFDGARRLKEGCSKLQSDTVLSVLYQAPETLLCKDIGKPADVFSFGVVLWEILTLCEPWEEKRSEHGQYATHWVRTRASCAPPYPFPSCNRLSWHHRRWQLVKLLPVMVMVGHRVWQR